MVWMQIEPDRAPAGARSEGSVAEQDAAAATAEVQAARYALVGSQRADAAELVLVIVEAGPADAAVVGAEHARYAVDHAHHVHRGRVLGAGWRLAQGDGSGAVHVGLIDGLPPDRRGRAQPGPGRARIERMQDALTVHHPDVALRVGIDRHRGRVEVGGPGIGRERAAL